MLLFVVALGTGGTYALCQYVPRTYRSKVSLMFKRPLNKSPISTDQGDRALEVFVKGQQQIVMSDVVLARAKVISEDANLRQEWFRLRDDWEVARASSGGTVPDALDAIGRFLERDVSARVLHVLGGEQADLREFRDSAKLETPGGEQVAMTESFTLSVKRPSERDDPDSYKNAMYAADILADMYMVRYQELQQTLNDPAVRVMDDVIKAYEAEGRGEVQEYRDFVQANRADIGVLEQLLKSGTEHGTQIVLTKVRENDARLSLELARDRAIHQVMSAALPSEALEPGGVSGMEEAAVEAALAAVSAEFVQENLGFGELLKQMVKLEAKRAEAEAQYTKESRDVRFLREEILQGKRQLLRAIVAHVKGLGNAIKARERQMAEHRELVRSTAEEQNLIQAKLARYATLKNNFQVVQKHMEKLRQERVDAMSNRLRARDSVMIAKLDPASVPDVDRPVTPRPLLYTLVAFVVSSLMGVACAFLADHFDHTLRSSFDAERYLGIPVLGSVKKRGRKLVVGV